MVMGHELTHGFDDEGRQFDGKGNLRDWWTPTVGSEFEQRAQCVAEQFYGYVAVDDIHLNGKLTLGENLADLGGLKLAHAAYVAARGGASRSRSASSPTISSSSWAPRRRGATKRRPELSRVRAATDPHSPPRVPHQRADVESARVRRGILVQAGRQDGAPDPVHRLVTSSPMSMQDHFDQIADAELKHLEQTVGEMDPDEAEVDLSQGVLTITLADDNKIVINSHHAAGEIWMAAFRQAWHFGPRELDGKVEWRTAKDELRATLSRLLSEKLGRAIAI